MIPPLPPSSSSSDRPCQGWEPQVRPDDVAGLVRVTGRFFRAVGPQYADSALVGSRSPGRFSRASEPTLYLSASVEGVEAAMRAHRAEGEERVLVAADVDVGRILDLRDPQARDAAQVSLQEAAAPWQQIVADGGRAALLERARPADGPRRPRADRPLPHGTRAVAPRPLPLGAEHGDAGPTAAITPLSSRKLAENGSRREKREVIRGHRPG